MEWSILFFVNSVLLGVGLAMDAFSVSIVNGMNNPTMYRREIVKIAGVFGFFQALMPMLGWIFTHTMVQYFVMFQKLVPWIALVLLLFIGGKMILDSRQPIDVQGDGSALTWNVLLMQGVATSIDALSVGFAIANYGFAMALTCALIVATVTFVICVSGVHVGRRVGIKLSGKSSLFGGMVLIAIGIEIFITGIF